MLIIEDCCTKVRNMKEENIVGFYGLGNWNEAGDWLNNFRHSNDLFIVNTVIKQSNSTPIHGHHQIKYIEIKLDTLLLKESSEAKL